MNKRIAGLLMVLVLLVTACSSVAPTPASTRTPISTQDPTVTATATAAPTATVVPTSTPRPAVRVTVTPIPTVTSTALLMPTPIQMPVSTKSGKVYVDVVDMGIAPRIVDIGTESYLITALRVSVTGEDGIFQGLRMWVQGTMGDEDLGNWKLFTGTGILIAEAERAVNGILELPSLSHMVLRENSYEYFMLVADVENGTGRGAQLVLVNETDLVIQGVTSGRSLSIAPAGILDRAFPIGDLVSGNAGFNKIEVVPGRLIVTKARTSPFGTFVPGQQNIVLGAWELEALGEDIQIEQVDYEIGGSSDEGDFVGIVRLMTEAGEVLHSQDAKTRDLFDDDDAANDEGDQVTLFTPYTIPAGTILRVKLVADAAITISRGETVIGGLGSVHYKTMVSGFFSTAPNISSHIMSGLLEAVSGTLNVANNAVSGDIHVIEGQRSVLLGSYLFQAGVAEGLVVQSLNVSIIAGDVPVATGLTKLQIRRADTGETLGVINSPAATNNQFFVLGSLNILPGETVQVDVYGNISTAASDGGSNDNYVTYIGVGDVMATGRISGLSFVGPSTTVSGRRVTVVEQGTFSVSVETTGERRSQFFISNLQEAEMVRLKFCATVEDVGIEQLVLRSVNGSGNIANVKLLGTGFASDPSVPLLADKATFTFPVGKGIVVSAYGCRVLTVRVNVTELGTTVAGTYGALGIGVVQARGVISGVEIQASVTGTHYTAGTDAYSGDVGDVIYFTKQGARGTYTSPGFYMVTVDDDAVNLVTGDLELNGEFTDTSWSRGDVITKLHKVGTDTGSIDDMAMALAVGDLVYVYDQSDPEKSGFKIVKTAVPLGGDATGANTVDDITLVARDFITLLTNANGLMGSTMRFEEVKPLIYFHLDSPQGVQVPAADQVVGIIQVVAFGYRDLTFDGLVIQKKGDSADWNVKDFKLYNGDNLISEVSGLAANTRTTVDAGAQTTAVEVGDTLGFAPGDAVLYIDRDEEANSGVTTVASVTDRDSIVLATDVIGVARATDQLIKYSVFDQDTSVMHGVTYEVADASRYQVGDQLYIISQTDAADSGGAVVSIVSADRVAVTQIALPGIADNAAAVANGESATLYNITRGSDTVVFNSTSPTVALAEQIITARQTMTLTVLADTSTIKRGSSPGETVTFSVIVPGDSDPLSQEGCGLRWDYTPLNTAGLATYRTQLDSCYAY